MSIADQFRRSSGLATLLLASLASGTVQAGPTVADALKLTPTQKDVDFALPEKDDIEKCAIKAEKFNNQTGWVIRDKAGEVLRRFVDTNSDNVVDQWSYYLDGLEVYRDIDADFNGKPDQCRWFNTAGIRWGLDTNEDGKIDRWKEISAEEVSDELVRALAEKDTTRFARLLLAADELKALGLGEARMEELKNKATAASEEFHKTATTQKTLAKDAKWLQFGGARPGVVPAGTDGSTKDLTVYENAVVVAESGGKHIQLQIGTLVRVGDTWRLVGPPQIEGEAGTELTRTGGLFGQPQTREQADDAAQGTAGGPPQKLLTELENIDKASDESADPAEQAKYAAQKAQILQEIAAAVTSPEDRAQWVRQAADFMSATVQSGNWPAGVERLAELHAKLAKDPAGEELASYVEFRYLTAEYGRDLSAQGADFAKVQTKWLASLEKFVKDHPKSGDTAEAMLQLAMAQEFAGQDEEAKKWYDQIRTSFPETATAKKAAGAITRLDSVGKQIRLKGANVNPALAKTGPIDISTLKDKVVLVQYWATWCEPALVDLAQLKEVQAQYAKDGLVIVGVSLDNKAEDLTGYLKDHRLPWPQVFEPGGLDSRLANEMGILTLPTMILIGKDGKVVNRSVHITELEREIGNLLHPSTAKLPKK